MPRKSGLAGISVETVFEHTDAVDAAIKRACGNIVRKTVFDIEASAKLNASGRPGPRVVTGTLRNSIRSSYQEGALEGWVSVGAAYAPHVEFGHMQGGGHVPAYPFFYPAIEENKPKMIEAMRQAGAQIRP